MREPNKVAASLPLPAQSPIPKIGRPSKRSPELAEQICSFLSQGFSLRFACSELGIGKPFVLRWLLDSPEFETQYTRAREFQMESEADELIELADSATPENAHVVRLQVDTRKWVAAKLLPKKYGDRPAEINVTNNTLNVTVSEPQRVQLIERRRTLEAA